jgi:hypothetical protein
MVEVVFETIFFLKCIKIFSYFFYINISKQLKNIKNIIFKNTVQPQNQTLS